MENGGKWWENGQKNDGKTLWFFYEMMNRGILNLGYVARNFQRV